MPDDRPMIDALREIIAELRRRVEDAEPQLEPMRATIERYKAEIEDKTAEIAALRTKVESLEEGLNSQRLSYSAQLDRVWQKYDLPSSEKPWIRRRL